jgi:hypothetical protein
MEIAREERMLELDHEITPSGARSTFAFPDICRTVLNPQSYSFVAANAPCQAVNSFELRRQQLAIASLRVARSMLLQQLRMAGGDAFDSSFLQFCHSTISTLKSTLLLAACALGRMGLGVLSVLRHGIPQGLHLWASANILNNVGNLLTDGQLRNQPAGGEAGGVCVIDGRVLDNAYLGPLDRSAVTADILRALTVSLPTDLSRLIFLATLRDNNSGHYYHPEVARRFSDSVADQAMLACHQWIYRRVVALPLEDLTDELDRYIASVPVSRERLIESWKRLKAYRATIPIDADDVSSEIFFMKVEVAVAILESRVPGRIS